MAPARSFSAAVEDYLKAIYRLQAEIGGPVTTTDLGGWLGVTASSASGMLRKLDDLQLVSYEPYRGVQLSEVGWRAALAGGAPASAARAVPVRDTGAVLGPGT